MRALREVAGDRQTAFYPASFKYLGRINVWHFPFAQALKSSTHQANRVITERYITRPDLFKELADFRFQNINSDAVLPPRGTIISSHIGLKYHQKLQEHRRTV